MAPGVGHPLNAAFCAWVSSAVSSDPRGDWSAAAAAYLQHCDALLKSAQPAPPPAQARGVAPPPAPEQEAQEGPAAASGKYFGKIAAEAPASREANPFAQGLDFGGEVRGPGPLAALRLQRTALTPLLRTKQVARQKEAAAAVLAERAARQAADDARARAEAEAEARVTGSECVPVLARSLARKP